MMVRTQISLDDHDHALAKKRAAERGISLSELVRQALRRELGDPPGGGDLSEIFGIFNTGDTDTSSRVDELVTESTWEEYQRGKRPQ